MYLAVGRSKRQPLARSAADGVLLFASGVIQSELRSDYLEYTCNMRVNFSLLRNSDDERADPWAIGLSVGCTFNHTVDGVAAKTITEQSRKTTATATVR
jgi:hypothetical protein